MRVPTAIHRLCLAVLLAAPLAAGPARAQNAPLPFNLPPLTAPKPAQQPAALPGATGSAPAAERRPGSLAPNQALFDAINRGDKAAARDAVNRGADLNARNVLGLTPIELSVDLGRNDITFLLLSLRGSGTGGGQSRAVADAAPRLPIRAAPVTRVVAEAPSRPLARSAPSPRPAPVAPPVLSHDPGTPDPSAGFLGFGATRSP